LWEWEFACWGFGLWKLVVTTTCLALNRADEYAGLLVHRVTALRAGLS
jgi:hypothetical protein